jgi:tetratricopeptide (TPR) repeat protein
LSHSLTDTWCKIPLGGLWWPMLLVATLLGGCAGAPTRDVTVGADGAQAAPVWPAAAVKDYERALGLMDAGRDEEAAERLSALADRYPEYAGPLTNLGILAARRGDAEQAFNYLTLATSLCNTCAPAWNQLGILHREQGRFDAAEQAYLQALDSDPDYALAHYNLGVLYDLYQQRHETAVEHYERYVLLAEDLSNTDEVDRWIADLRRRLGEPPRTAQIGDPQ